MTAIKKRHGARGDRVRDERWSKLFAEAARDLLRALARRARPASRALLIDVERTLLHEVVDPNAGRRLLLRRVETRSQFALRYAA